MAYITSFTLKEKKHSCSSFIVFVCGNLSIATFFPFLSRFLNFFGGKVFIVTKCSVLGAIPCKGPPETVNWNFSVLKQFFHKIYPKTLKFLFPKNIFDCFHMLWISFCVYKRIKVFFVPDVTLLNATGNL